MSRRLRCTALLFMLVAVVPARAEWHQRSAPIMGTNVEVELWWEDSEAAAAAIDAVIAEMRRIDELMSTYKESSELSHINREAAAAPVPVSRELFELIDYALSFSRLTDGAFDITYASAGRLYDYRAGRRPDAAALERALPAIDYHHVHLDAGAMTVSFAVPGVVIDLGGIAKGHAVDRAIALLEARGIRHAIVTAGGDSRMLGDRRGKPWIIGIRDPRDRRQVITRLPLVDEAISTSGDYERYFEEDGVRYHHILSPKTGDSVRKVRSVTVIGPRAVETDGLSTSVFVLGPKAGMRLIETLAGIEAVIIDGDGRLSYSSGLEPPASAAPRD